MGKDHSILNFHKTNSRYPFTDGYPIHESAQCLRNYPDTKNVWEAKMSQITSQLDIYRGDVEDISRDLESNDILEVIVGSGDSKQKLLQDVKEMISIINTLRSNFGNIRSQLTTYYNRYGSADDADLNKYEAYKDAQAQKASSGGSMWDSNLKPSNSSQLSYRNFY